ncbi:hypothetical protein KKG29_03105 [Patescibacteria group bacterium]|nr:hypothetical protein [Patescibacteria group bacterium]MBU4000135.1 hypothetical protein [Patescibacteria group bacterium]MBU4056612.1 hypothetical protein [Patescibacteria group bacterium]MBU4368639.1 hypothetical protein [Patescibacteria group bacterium]
MALATHLIKIEGSFSQKWTEEKLREYVKQKILEIESFYHTDVELFRVQGNTIEVWVYISALPSEAKNITIGEWIKNHIKEDGIEVKGFEVKIIMSFLDPISEKPPQFMIYLP